jgi:hypothetical protein
MRLKPRTRRMRYRAEDGCLVQLAAFGVVGAVAWIASVALVLASTLVAAWPVMVAVGILHNVIAGVPRGLGYWEIFIIVLALRLILQSPATQVNTKKTEDA